MALTFPSTRKLEMFSRGRVPEGWTGWGLESEDPHRGTPRLQPSKEDVSTP